MKKNPHRGSDFDDFLKEDGIFDEVKAETVKRLLARELAAAMKEQRVSKSRMAERMGTSRAALDRLLDPENTSVTLLTMARAAGVLDRDLHFSLGHRA